MKYNNILEAVGNTPHLHINRIFPGAGNIWMKLERNNPAGSIKDRIALSMIIDAEAEGVIGPGSTIIEPTSGNTGIGLAMVAAVKGYRLILVMPESMSIERRSILKAYGAELILTPRELGMKGAIERSQELSREIGKSWIPSQFDNPSNPAIHERTTAKEIVADFPGGIDYLITGVGTGGHISGVARILKQEMSGIEVYAVEPAESPVIAGGEPGPHGIQGIGAGFIPRNLDTSLLDGTIQVEKAEAYDFARRVVREEGVFMGISSGASLAAVGQLLERVDQNSTILTFNYDTGERYLSVNDLF